MNEDAVEERHTIAPALTLGAAKLGALTIDWLLLRPCVFPTTLSRNLSIVAMLGSGSVLYAEDGTRIYDDYGEICVISPSLRRRTSFSERAEVLRISYSDELVQQVALEIGISASLDTLTHRKLTEPAVHEMVHKLAGEMRPGGSRAALYCTSLALALLGTALRGYPQKQRGTKGDAGLSPQRLTRALQYVEHRLGSELTIRELARAVDMSLFHFARAFKQSTGKTPHAYVLERRIAAAQSLVLNTTRPLSEISDQLGFSNPSHFSSVFGRLTGTTPSAYRLQRTSQT
jgi:AraC family transcriptional regulator